jgi:hypothetical protein
MGVARELWWMRMLECLSESRKHLRIILIPKAEICLENSEVCLLDVQVEGNVLTERYS